MRGPGMTDAVDGFWLPRPLRARLLRSDSAWAEACFARGRECGVECPPSEPGAVAARWPVLTPAGWDTLFEELAQARLRAPRGEEFWSRLQAALPEAARRLTGPESPARHLLGSILPAYTGFSPAMIAATVDSPDMWDLGPMAASFSHRPTKAQAARWRQLPGLPGRVRFFAQRAADRLVPLIPVAWEMPLFGPAQAPDTIIGYGAGNVPGTALIITLLGLATTLAGGPAPTIVVRNSRREPIFSPLVLSALEEVDEDLVSMVAVLVWDYDDSALQRRLLSRAGLVVAAAGDDTITQIDAALRTSAAPGTRPARFHPHGHKVSFSVIGREALDPVLMQSAQAPPAAPAPAGGGPVPAPAGHTWFDPLDMIALLTALDSAYWDQFGCLSSRIHFVEREDRADWVALEYAERLTLQLRRLSAVLPRGAWPLRHLKDTFDRYKALEESEAASKGLRMLSMFDDPFVVVLDEREAPGAKPDPYAFATAVNDCQGRVVIVRPVTDIMAVPRDYLSLLRPSSLQSLSVAMGRPGEGLSERFLEFAGACAARGVTAIRAAGRGALPQPAYSWDGFLPLDLVCSRPQGHFTTIEFDSPFDAMLHTYKAHLARLRGRVPSG